MGGLSFGLNIAALLSIVAVVAWGCGGGDDGARGTRRPTSVGEAAYHVIDVVNGGTLAGSVLWVGPQPELPTVRVEHHVAECGAERTLEALSVGPRGGVGATVVYLDAVTEGHALPEGPFDVAFRGCALAPRVLAVPAGASIRFHNDEDVLHNLHASRGGAAPWADLGLPARGTEATVSAPAAGVSTLLDDAGHPWISGFVHSFDHPYYAVTDADGRFRIPAIPPGQYTVRAWHEGVRVVPGEVRSGRPRLSAPLVLARPVVVTAGVETTVDFQLDLAAVEAAGD